MTRLLSLILLLSACQSRPVIEPSLEDVMLSDMEWMRKHFRDKPLTDKLNER